MQDAIQLALENNLDLAIARYNFPIAEADVLRTRAGGSFRGETLAVVQNTPGGGVGGFGSGASGAGAGGTSGGAGGAGSGANGLVSSTLVRERMFPRMILRSLGRSMQSILSAGFKPLGLWMPTLQRLRSPWKRRYSQAFPTGTSFSAVAQQSWNDQQSQCLFDPLSVVTFSCVQQQLLAGFGLGPNLRYLRIAKNNQKISDESFKLQVVTTITQIADMYWDLVAAYEDEGVKSRALDFANATLDSGRKQLSLQAIPAMDVMKTRRRWRIVNRI